MARKNLLKGLMEQAKTTDQAGTEPDRPPIPRRTTGAIGAVSKSIADLKSRSVVDLDPFAIKAGGLHDRLEHDESAHKVLMQSIRDYGQQVPVLVRPDPDEDGIFRIVYGRRRVLALRDLGQPVKAMIRDLDDTQAILAQGQENSARRDLSFIERCNFARQMVEAGYDRKVIADALATDKTLISRMLTVADTLPVGLIERIGAAPNIGRDRWLTFAKMWQVRGHDEDDAAAQIALQNATQSDARFEGLFAWLKGSAKPAAVARIRPGQKSPVLNADGKKIGALQRTGKTLRIELSETASDGFDRWLETHLSEIHRDWLKTRGE